MALFQCSHNLTWTNDTINRSAGEYPTQLKNLPLLASVTDDDETSILYNHETGTDDDGAAMSWSLSTPFFDVGTDTANVVQVIPDSIQTGDITCVVNVKKFPQSANLYGDQTLTISPTTEVLSFRENSRFIQYVLSGSVIGQGWRAGKWLQVLSRGGRR